MDNGSFTARTVEMVSKEEKKVVKGTKKIGVAKKKITILKEPQGVKKG